MYVWRDLNFWAALVAAPLFWGVLLFIQEPSMDFGWPLRTPVAFLLPVLVYPILEEAVFRGLVQEHARDLVSRKTLGPVSVANVMSSILFAALHVALGATPWRAWVFFPSLVFGYFKDRYGRLTAPIVLHIVYNSGYFWLFHSNHPT